MRILYYDTTAHIPLTPLFDESLEALGNEFVLVDEARFLGGQPSLARRVVNRLRRHPAGYASLNRRMAEEARRFRPDLVLVSKGTFLSARTLAEIKAETGALLVNWATDDPFNRASRLNTVDMIESLPLYDLCASTKTAIIQDLERAGCKHVTYVRFGYKPSVHFPEPGNGNGRFDSDAVFIGGCDRDRIPWFDALIKSIPGLRMHLYGVYWNRVPSLRRYWRGFAWGASFRHALAGSKIAINLVRRANRDDHVMRTFELPACGAFMLAERTDTHLELFEEEREAAYFSSADELAGKVRYYLAHDAERMRIAEAGYRKLVNGRHTYDDRLAQIIDVTRGLT